MQMESALAVLSSPVLWLAILVCAAAWFAVWFNQRPVAPESDIYRWAQKALERGNELEYPSYRIGDTPLALASGYRRSRATTSTLSALALAWSAGQVNIQSVAVVAFLGLEFATVAIPLLLSAGIIYSLLRSGLEFSMQPVEVRRWKLARWDFRMVLFLSRGALLILPAASVYRSLSTGVVVVAAFLLVAAIGCLFVLVATIAITPIMLWIRARQGRYSAMPRVFESMAWAYLIGMVALALICLAAAVIAIRSGWVPLYDPLAVVLLALSIVIVAYSFISETHYLNLIFAVDPGAPVTRGAGGRLQLEIHGSPNTESLEHKLPTDDERGLR